MSKRKRKTVAKTRTIVRYVVVDLEQVFLKHLHPVQRELAALTNMVTLLHETYQSIGKAVSTIERELRKKSKDIYPE